MSGSQPADPSMEDILASIRRILNEDDGAAAATPAGSPAAAATGAAAAGAAADRRPAPRSDVFALDASMIVADSPAARERPTAVSSGPPAAEAPRAEPPPLDLSPPEPAWQEPRQEPRLTLPLSVAAAPAEPVKVSEAAGETPAAAPAEAAPPSWPAPLVAPEAAAAAALSVGSLRRTLEAGRASLAVRSVGPTLEDMVREELRPVLKAWLDANLAAVVERLVRAEIERVVSRGDL